MHSDMVEKVMYFPEIDKYITCGRDATFRVWNTGDLKQNCSLMNGLRWISDAVYLKDHRKLCVASMDRSLTWYDVNRGSYECIGKCVPILEFIACFAMEHQQLLGVEQHHA